ncbi:hypothetical protein EJ04DRAFT_580981 [Polyplosphaeria fusca]|uniref:Uncharacterized protein n=1 Tax=Polyplosphaeria fusca TaxID=682080 RepID=A0A9P4QQ97_9PLEO|nr:hypothetical protein EJ04DRAFT_580981 [Polyplosphaeria fusca]
MITLRCGFLLPDSVSAANLGSIVLHHPSLEESRTILIPNRDTPAARREAYKVRELQKLVAKLIKARAKDREEAEKKRQEDRNYLDAELASLRDRLSARKPFAAPKFRHDFIERLRARIHVANNIEEPRASPAAEPEEPVAAQEQVTAREPIIAQEQVTAQEPAIAPDSRPAPFDSDMSDAPPVTEAEGPVVATNAHLARDDGEMGEVPAATEAQENTEMGEALPAAVVEEAVDPVGPVNAQPAPNDREMPEAPVEANAEEQAIAPSAQPARDDTEMVEALPEAAGQKTGVTVSAQPAQNRGMPEAPVEANAEEQVIAPSAQLSRDDSEMVEALPAVAGQETDVTVSAQPAQAQDAIPPESNRVQKPFRLTTILEEIGTGAASEAPAPPHPLPPRAAAPISSFLPPQPPQAQRGAVGSSPTTSPPRQEPHTHGEGTGASREGLQPPQPPVLQLSTHSIGDVEIPVLTVYETCTEYIEAVNRIHKLNSLYRERVKHVAGSNPFLLAVDQYHQLLAFECGRAGHFLKLQVVQHQLPHVVKMLDDCIGNVEDPVLYDDSKWRGMVNGWKQQLHFRELNYVPTMADADALAAVHIFENTRQAIMAGVWQTLVTTNFKMWGSGCSRSWDELKDMASHWEGVIVRCGIKTGRRSLWKRREADVLKALATPQGFMKSLRDAVAADNKADEDVAAAARNQILAAAFSDQVGVIAGGSGPAIDFAGQASRASRNPSDLALAPVPTTPSRPAPSRTTAGSLSHSKRREPAGGFESTEQDEKPTKPRKVAAMRGRKAPE